MGGGDPVQKKKEELVLHKINEVISTLNTYDLNNMSKLEQEEAKNILRENKDVLKDIY